MRDSLHLFQQNRHNMYQRIGFPTLLLVFTFLSSCGGKKNADSTAKNTTTIEQSGRNEADADTTLSAVQPFIEKELALWVQSFNDFNIDSFHQVVKREFQENDYGDMATMEQFYSFYKPSLSFSPDSSQFIDLYSSGISLEKRDKKIIAIGDVDQGVTLCNLKTKNWKSIISFGPSAGMEEALWVSSTKFILAGSMQNDDGNPQPVILLGDTDKKTFRWFEASFIREKSAKYEASGFSKLKIDEWE